MTIDKAIELLKELSTPGIEDLLPDDYNAIKLGIEALSYYQILRIKGIVLPDYHLPGETEE